MGYLLDTHAFLWAILQPHRLSRRVTSLLINSESRFFLSVISIWEIAIKTRSGKLDVPSDPEILARHMEIAGIQTLPVGIYHVNLIFHLPDHHRDPFDRLLI